MISFSSFSLSEVSEVSSLILSIFSRYWVFQKGMYSLIGGKLAKASSARKNSKIN
jgi:hypothetical protein